MSDLEKRVLEMEKRLDKLEALVSGRSLAAPAGLESALAEKVDEINTQDLIVVSLRLNKKQTKAEIKKTLQDWGKAFGNWFEGGNFNGRLVKKGVVKKEGENGAEDVYALTRKGELRADELIAQLKAGS